MAAPNTHSAFTGSIPENYDRFLGPLIFIDYAKDLAQRLHIRAGGKVLELAAGTGILTESLRHHLAEDVEIMVTDLNPDMLAFAQNKLQGQKNLRFRVMDATQLDVEAGSFDAVVCQFSLMFFPDKAKAIAEVRRVLKPGGHFIFNLWDALPNNHFAHSVWSSVQQLYPENPPDFFDVPFGYHDIEVVKTLLGQHTFEAIHAEVLPRMSHAAHVGAIARGCVLGTPLCHQIKERGSLSQEALIEKIEEDLQNKFGPGPIKAPMQSILFQARRPL